MIPIRFITTHRADFGHVEPLRQLAEKDPRFKVVDDNSGIVFVQGDRTELLGEIMSAVADNAVIAHAAGGERTKGSTDDRVRDAITKLAHLHYPVHREAERRLVDLGEEPWRIYVVGEIGVDTIMNMEDEPLPDMICPIKGDVILAVHPVTSRPSETGWILNHCCSAVYANHKWLVTPNGDPGSDEIESKWDDLCADGSATRLGELTHRQFITVMRRCGAIVGNSSCLITEAPHAACVSVLLGTRQEGRMLASSDGHACEKILDSMAGWWPKKNLRDKA